MNYKKIEVFVLLISILLIPKVASQNRLEPYNESIFDSSPDRFDYYSEIRKTLFEKVHEEYTPLARYIVIPSFQPEYALSFDIDFPKHYLTLIRAKQKISIKLEDKNAKIETIKIKKEIDSTDIKLIVSLIKESINKSEISKRYGYDGTNYFFSNSEKTAKIWSPKENTQTRYLIEVMDEIIQLIESEEKTIKFSPQLIEKIKKLNLEKIEY